MAVYGVVGKLSTGKTKFAVFQASNAILQDRKIAGNVDLKPWLMDEYNARTYIRIPDKPTAEDLNALGHGNPDSYDEDKNGILILDELGTWLNTRSFQDKGRAAVIDWLIHARKLGWDVYLIVQDEGMIDKQVRDALIEYQCRCVNLSKVRVPFVGGFLSMLHKPWGYLPRMHSVTARLGYGANAIVAQRWTYRGDHLHQFYDTRQIFKSDYPHGVHSVLPPWDWKPKRHPLQWLVNLWTGSKNKQQRFTQRRRQLGVKPPWLEELNRSGLSRMNEWLVAQPMARVAEMVQLLGSLLWPSMPNRGPADFVNSVNRTRYFFVAIGFAAQAVNPCFH